MTSDINVLDIVQHCYTEFINGLNPINTIVPKCHFSWNEEKIIKNEIKLLDMGVIIKVNHQPDEFLSPIFTIPKKDGEYRMILNLKQLHKNIEYHHFKMDTFESALKLIKPNCFMASVYLRHAYYSVPVAEDHQIKLRFVFQNTVYQLAKWNFLCP